MPCQAVPLTETRIKSFRAKDARYQVSDTGGLLLEIMSSGSKYGDSDFNCMAVVAALVYLHRCRGCPPLQS